MGIPHPDYLLQSLTCRQLQEWMEYAAIEPFGEYQADLRHGQQMHLLDRAHFKRETPVTPNHFRNYLIEEPKAAELTEEERFALIDKEAFGL